MRNESDAVVKSTSRHVAGLRPRETRTCGRSLSKRFACTVLSVGCMLALSASAVVWNVFPVDVRTVGIVSVSDIVNATTLARATNELSNAGYAVKVMPNVLGPK